MQIKVPSGLVSGEALLLDHRELSSYSVLSHSLSLQAQGERERSLVPLFLPVRAPVLPD